MTTDPIFAAFCEAGLWPGLGRKLAASLAEAGIDSPADVSVPNLTALPKIGPLRANRLLSSFIGANPVYEVVELLVPAGIEARIASRVVDALGPPAARLLRAANPSWRKARIPDPAARSKSGNVRSHLWWRHCH